MSVNNEVDFDLDDEVREILGEDIGSDPINSSGHTSNSKKRARSSTSKCQEYFTKLDNTEDGKERAACNKCRKVYLVGGKSYGTTNLNKHMKICPLRDQLDVGQMLIDADGKIRARKIDQKIFLEKKHLL